MANEVTHLDKPLTRLEKLESRVDHLEELHEMTGTMLLFTVQDYEHDIGCIVVALHFDKAKTIAESIGIQGDEMYYIGVATPSQNKESVLLTFIMPRNIGIPPNHNDFSRHQVMKALNEDQE